MAKPKKRRDPNKAGREFLKDSIRLEFDFRETDQSRGIEPPPLEKEHEADETVIALPGRDTWGDIGKAELLSCIENRESRRTFSDESLSQKELSYLLWTTQGIRRGIGPGTALRNVPSAGCRHAFETYLAVFNVEGLNKGIYRYSPSEHGLIFLSEPEEIEAAVADAALGQKFCGTSAVTFFWTVIPYRMEWRYGPAAHRVIPIDVGHVCQNLYLAAESIKCGTCAVGAYDQKKMDELLGVNGEEEFTLYLAPVGRIKRET